VPRYHFDWALGNHRVRHALGFDLPDDAARAHAESEIRELLETTMGKRLGKDCAIEVCDAKRYLLFRVSCKDFLKKNPAQGRVLEVARRSAGADAEPRVANRTCQHGFGSGLESSLPTPRCGVSYTRSCFERFSFDLQGAASAAPLLRFGRRDDPLLH
jgi:hypothetical protein